MILADENLPEAIVEALVVAGFPVVHMAAIDLGADDTAVLRHALDRGLIVVTQDMDFGDLVYRDGEVHAGVVLVRLRGMPFADKAQRVVSLFEEHGDRLSGKFTVLSNAGVRIR